ncbi:MAG: signal peptidase I [Planctomycetota bacterium]|jgi:signal peptidase I
MSKNEKKKNEKNNVKEWIFSILGAVAVAFAIKMLILDIYSIPTGSMEPTLHGVAHAGDRVLCTKFNYHLRENKSPKRWEVFVFKYPGEGEHKGENYIKRCVGLPNETLFIIDGDIYTRNPLQESPEIARKPLNLQNSIWLPTYRSNFKHENEKALSYHWDRPVNPSHWSFKNGRLKASTSEATHLIYRPVAEGVLLSGIPDRHIKRQVVTFECSKCNGKLRKTVFTQQLTAFCPACGEFMSEENIDRESFIYPGTAGTAPVRMHSFWNKVSDLKVEFNLIAEAARGNIQIELKSDSESYKAVLPLDSTASYILNNGSLLKRADSPAKLQTGKSYKISFCRFDSFLLFEINNKKILSINLKLRSRERLLRGIDKRSAGFESDESGIALAVENGNINIDKIKIYRDIHFYPFDAKKEEYLKPNDPKFFIHPRYIEIPTDNFFALGDNSPTSNDSRGWGFVPRDNLIGPAILVWWPLHRAKIIK